MRIKMTLAYDGTNYYGFQHQPNFANIEDELLKAIQKIDKEVEKIIGSGRTDRYVHAKGQVIHFDTNKNIEPFKWVMAVNTFLPEDIKILSCEYVSDDFHARYSVKSKEYHYHLRFNNDDLFVRNYTDYALNIDFDLMLKALKKLEGKHDFRGFCSAQIHEEKGTIKEIYKIEVIKNDDLVVISFLGDGFLKYQIRKMMGTVIDIASGKKDIQIIDEIFNTCNPELTNRVLKGHGLYLVKVNY